jgi:peptide/nickel transport system ATP-binding protein
VSVQAQILNLLEDLKDRYGLTLVFITHDLAVVKNISDRVAVMYLGKVCEVADPELLYSRPAHPYTAALVASIPVPDPAAVDRSAGPAVSRGLAGELPSPLNPPSGCRFRTRCPRAQDLCAAEEPQVREVADGQFVACHFPLVGEQAAAASTSSASSASSASPSGPSAAGPGADGGSDASGPDGGSDGSGSGEPSSGEPAAT